MPVPPNQRRKAASVMTRSSGTPDADRIVLSDADSGVLRITGMPRGGGTVYLNGDQMPGIGWSDPATMTQYDVRVGNPPVWQELRITDASGVDYLLPNDPTLISHLNGAHYVGFSDFVPTEGTLRVNGVAHSITLGGVLLPRPGGSVAEYVLPVGQHSLVLTTLDGTNRQMTTDVTIDGGMRTVVNFAPDLAAALSGTPRTSTPRRSITDVSTNDSLDRSNTTGVFSITGVPSDVVGLTVKQNARVLPGTLAGGTWTASSFDVSDAAVISVQPTTAGGVMGEGIRGRALTRTVAILAAGLSIAYSTLTSVAQPSYTDVTAPPAMTGIVLVGDINSIGGATFSLDGVAVPYAPGAAQWLPTTPAYTKLVIPAPAGAHVVRLIKGGRTLMASATVAANLVTDVPVSNMTVETQGTTQQLTDTPTPPAMTGIVLVGDINSIGGATFSLDGVAVPYAPGAAQWLPTTPAYTKLVIPAPAGARVVRLIKGGQTLVANATVAAGQVTEIPVTGMMQELTEIKADDQKDKVPAVVPPTTTQLEVGPVRPPPSEMYPPQARLPQPQPGMSMTSKLIIGGLVAAALGGGYYWYSMQPKANPGKKDCGCGCGGKGGCG